MTRYGNARHDGAGFNGRMVEFISFFFAFIERLRNLGAQRYLRIADPSNFRRPRICIVFTDERDPSTAY